MDTGFYQGLLLPTAEALTYDLQSPGSPELCAFGALVLHNTTSRLSREATHRRKDHPSVRAPCVRAEKVLGDPPRCTRHPAMPRIRRAIVRAAQEHRTDAPDIRFRFSLSGLGAVLSSSR